MIDFSFYFIIIFISIFGFFSIREDIKHRKVNNKLNLSFLIISIIIFLYFIKKIILSDFIIIFLIIILSFYLFQKKIWGAADGKFFIAISLIVFSEDGINLFLVYLTNLALIYSLSIFILTQFKTSKRIKINTIKKIDYLGIFFILFFSIIIINFIFYFTGVKNSLNYLIFIILFIFTLMFILNKLVLKNFKNLNLNKKVLINLILIIILITINNFSFPIYYLILYLLKLFIEYISVLSSKLKTKNKKNYYSPFVVYLFFGLIITLILKKSIIQLLILIFL